MGCGIQWHCHGRLYLGSTAEPDKGKLPVQDIAVIDALFQMRPDLRTQSFAPQSLAKKPPTPKETVVSRRSSVAYSAIASSFSLLVSEKA